MVLIPPTRGVLQNLSQREIEYLEQIANQSNNSVDTIEEVANVQQSIVSSVSLNSSLIFKLTEMVSSLDNRLQLIDTMNKANSARIDNMLRRLIDTQQKLAEVKAKQLKTPQGVLEMVTPDTQIVNSGSTDVIDVFDTATFQSLTDTDITANTITLQKSGIYAISYVANLDIDTNNTTVRIAAYRNGVEIRQTVYQQNIQNSATDFNATLSMPVIAFAGETFDLRVSHDNGGAVTFDFDEMAFALIGEKI